MPSRRRTSGRPTGAAIIEFFFVPTPWNSPRKFEESGRGDASRHADKRHVRYRRQQVKRCDDVLFLFFPIAPGRRSPREREHTLI